MSCVLKSSHISAECLILLVESLECIGAWPIMIDCGWSFSICSIRTPAQKEYSKRERELQNYKPLLTVGETYTHERHYIAILTHTV